MLAPTEAITAADCLLAMAALNRHVKRLEPPKRAGVYALKERLCKVLCERGCCIGAELEIPASPLYDWQIAFTFDVDGTVAAFHLPRSRVLWDVEERQAPRHAPYRAEVKLTPREAGALCALVARWLEVAER